MPNPPRPFHFRYLAAAFCGVWLVGLSACTHTTGGGQQHGDSSSPSFAEKLQPVSSGGPECPAETRACSEEWNPTRCTAEGHEGEALVLYGRLMAWGDNPCLAREKLRVAACAAGVLPSQLERLSCIPDVSQGRCGTEPKPCAEEPAAQPRICVLRKYAGQATAGDSALAGFGLNECLARQALDVELCGHNLDPMRIENVECAADDTGGECPPTTGRCPAGGEATKCAVVVSSASSPNLNLEANGRNLCEAQVRLRLAACRVNRRPSMLAPMTCETAKNGG